MRRRKAYAEFDRKRRWGYARRGGRVPALLALAGVAILATGLGTPVQSAHAQSAALDQYSGVPGPTPQAAARARRAAGISAPVTVVPSAPERLPLTGYPVNRVVLALFSLLVAALVLRAALVIRSRRTHAA